MARRGKSSGIYVALQEIGADASKAALEALDKGADIVIAEAKNRVPVRSGKLRDSIKKKSTNGGSVIKITAPATSKGGTEYGKYVEYAPKIDKPFLHPSLRAARGKVKQLIIDAIRGAVGKHAKS